MDDEHWRASLERFLADESSPEERERVEAWLRADPARQAYLQSLRTLGETWAKARPTFDTREGWRKVAAGIGSETAAPAAERRQANRRAPDFGPVALRIAASIVLVVGAALGGRALLAPPLEPAADAPSFSVITTTRGQRLSIRLADSTLVALAPGTTLRTPATYGVRERMVELDGEAAFTVTHDSSRPFSVRTRLAVARDLGTQFVVRAYADDPNMEVVVAEGLVAVGRGADSAAAPLSSDSVVIAQGERVRVDPDGRLALTKGVSLDRYFGWTEGRLVFRRTPLREAIAQLGRWYDLDIRLASPALGERGLTASFSEREPASQVLQVITTVLRLEATATGRGSYTLRARR